MDKKQCEPLKIFDEYKNGIKFKAGLGSRGMYDQNKINERFLVGDQWYGANCGNDRPLVRYNVVKRIADYKMAVIGSNPIAVNYSADGVPNTVGLKEKIQPIRDGIAAGDTNVVMRFEQMAKQPIPTDEEINIVMGAMSDYFKVTSERVKFDDIKEQALRNAYVSGTGIVYTWWDDRICTGMYADESRTTPVKGDISCEVLDIENVYFGDPNLDDIQGQPFIIIAQRKSVAELRREAKRNNIPDMDIQAIVSDTETGYMAGERSEDEPAESEKTTVLTKFWKEWDKDGQTFTIKAVKVCEKAVIRPEWDIGIRLYPFAKFTWERRRNCAYGESEITYLIPNQIAINRMITASVWAVMMMGMPIMVVNGDTVQEDITNDPGQVIKVFGGADDVATSIRYVNPPNFSPKFDDNIASLVSNTLTQSGANDAALGDMRPENTSAIIAVREAATMPLQQVQNRYYSFCEDIARIWSEFWVMQYGKRSLKVEDDTGTWYMPFDGDRYKDLLISTKIDVGASTLWSESQSIRTLDNLFDRKVIDVFQYLSRLPKGTIPNVNGLLRDLKAANAAASVASAQQTGAGIADAQAQSDMPVEQDIVAGLSPEYQEIFSQFDPNTRAALMRGAMNTQALTPESMPTGAVL